MNITDKPLVWLHSEVKHHRFQKLLVWKLDFYFANFNWGKYYQCHTQDQCRVSGLIVMNCESVIET